MTYTGWIANALLLSGSFWVGGKRRTGFALIALGEITWLLTVLSRTPIQWDMVFICVVFGTMAGINWYRWGMIEQQGVLHDDAGTDEA